MSATGTRRAFLAGLCAAPVAVSASADAVAPPMTAVAFSADGKHIVAGSQAGLSIRDSASDEVLKIHDVGMDNIHCLQFAPVGSLLAVAGGNPAEGGLVELLRWPSLQRQQRLSIHADVIYDIDFSSDGKHWVAASGDEVCSVYQLDSDQAVARFTRHSRGVLAAVFLPKGEMIVSASRDETLRVWLAANGEDVRTLHNHSRDVLDLAVKQPATGLPLIASASADLTVRFWQPTIGRMVRFTRLPSVPLCIDWCGGGNLIAGCEDGIARLINPDTVEVEAEFSLSPAWLYSLDVDPTHDHRIVFGTGDGEIQRLALPPNDTHREPEWRR